MDFIFIDLFPYSTWKNRLSMNALVILHQMVTFIECKAVFLNFVRIVGSLNVVIMVVHCTIAKEMCLVYPGEAMTH